MVMERESAHSPELLKWYKDQTSALSADPLFRFFNDQRVHTIHRGNVLPDKGTFPYDSLSVTERQDPYRGVVKGFHIRGKGPTPRIRPNDVINTTTEGYAIFWSFPAAEKYLPNGSTNVFRLCEDYFVRLKTIVHAWLAVRASSGGGNPAG